MLGRLFHGFEQRVERFLGEHVDFVNDVDFESCVASGRQRRIADELAGVFDGSVGSTVDFDDVQVMTGHDGFGHAILDILLGVIELAGWDRAIGDGRWCV